MTMLPSRSTLMTPEILPAMTNRHLPTRRHSPIRFRQGCLFLFSLLLACVAEGKDPERGYRLLTETPYITPDFDEHDFAEVWKVWPEPLRSQAERARPEERRRMAFSRYGLTPRPDARRADDGSLLPLQYVVSQKGIWTMNCFSCHGGQVLGKVVPGLPNSRYALQTLSEEMRTIKLEQGKRLARMDASSALIPLGTTRGTTNAVVFGIGLMSQRDADLNVVPNLSVPRFVHHDMDPPPWWHYRKKTHIYADGYAERNHRALMQFMLIRSNGPEKFHRWEEDFQDVAAYLESLDAPKYPFPIDEVLAKRGEAVFVRQCAECHGTYGKHETYPNRVVPIEELGTDRARLDALTVEGRRRYSESWFGHYGKSDDRVAPDGYQAPPLDGVWATAPYFHNGSVPTLWHVLNPSERPVVWRRTSEDGYDQKRVGLPVEALNTIPADVTDPRDRREYFDTSRFGKNAGGHHFPDALTEKEKRAVLEYLKTL